MHKAWYFLMVAAITCVILVTGCISQDGAQSLPAAVGTTAVPATAGPEITGEEVTSPSSLPGMALSLSDFPPGFELVLAGETMPPDGSTFLADPDYHGGYSVIVSNESSDLATGALVEQVILIYTRPVTRGELAAVFAASYPEIANWSLLELDDPGIGDASIAYRFAYPDTTLSGYSIAFGRGDIYEIIMTMAADGSAEYALVEDIGKKAAAKLP